MRDALKTLFHPFDSGVLPMAAKGSRTLFIGADPGFRLPDGFGGSLACVQGFRPDFLALAAMKHHVTPQAEGDGYGLALVLCGRHRGDNERRIAEAIVRVAPGGLVVVGGGKEDGLASLKARVGKILPIAGHLPKYHGVAFWFERDSSAEAAAIQLLADNPASLIDGRFETHPGMFSHGRADAGSLVLLDHLPDRVGGSVADFGAGWGFLAVSVADHCPDVSRIDLYEADHAALECARANMARLAPRVEADFHWVDLEKEPVVRRYDWIVMNPPFHRTHAAEPSIGQGLIVQASKSLKKNGRLVMVANRQLPYEETLSAAFDEVRELARDSVFKVMFARK